MSKLITQMKRVALALCLATPIVSWATPTATVVWRSNLEQSYSIYAVTQRDAALSEGNLTVSSTWGTKAPYFDMEGLGSGTVSVLVKYSGLDIAQIYDSDAYSVGVAFASVIDSDNNVIGACVQKADSANTVRAYYCGASSSEATPRDIGSMTAVGGEGYLLFSYKHDTGSRTYMGTSIDSLTGGQDTAGHWSNRTVKKLVLGGDESGKAFNGAGFKIEEVAIFVGSYLSNEDVADYVFPTINIDTTATMTMTELNTAVAAENTFNYFSASPVVTLDVEPSDATKAYLRSGPWNGTVFIKDKNIANLDPTAYGNKNSTLKLSGVSGHWGATVYANTATPAIELEDSETEGREYGYFASNGYSFYSQGYYYYVHTPELKGSGTYKANTEGNGALFVADKFDNFTGKLDLAGKTVWLGTGAPTHSQDTFNNLVNFPGTVRLGGSTIPSTYSTWNVPNGYKGTVEVAANDTNNASDLFASSVWKGIVVVPAATNSTTGHIRIMLAKLGNENSVVQFNGLAADTKDYYLNSGDSPTYNTTVDVNGWVEFSQGSSGKTITFSKVTGSNADATLRLAFPGTAVVNYTITTLDQFAGTLSVNGYAPLTIGTINLAAAPAAGAKVVKLVNGSYLKNVSSIKVSVNGVVDDTIELEQKEDGLYVVAPNVASITVSDEVFYYTSLTGEGGAIANTMNFMRVIELLADVNEAYELDPEAGRPLKVKLNGFTWTGVSAPEGYKVSTSYVEATGVTQYSCVVDAPDKARIGETGYQEVSVALQAALPMAVGTVVNVLDSTYKPSDTPYLYTYFTWAKVDGLWNATRTYTIDGAGDVSVTAETELAALGAVTITAPSQSVFNALEGFPYGNYFKKTAVEKGSGVWTVSSELNKAAIFEGDASETATVTATLAGVLNFEATKITIPAKRGLYYSFKSGDEVTAMTEGERKLANGATVELDKVDGDTFYQVLVNTTDK